MANVVDFNSAVIQEIVKEGEDLRIRFSNGNIHPANDASGGWKQLVELFLKQVEIIGDLPKVPVDLDDCYILVALNPRTMPIPHEQSGEIELQLVFSSGALVIKSTHIQLSLIGEPVRA